eukprot:2458576-Lingulodinium_polyedra.AAC.1
MVSRRMCWKRSSSSMPPFPRREGAGSANEARAGVGGELCPPEGGVAGPEARRAARQRRAGAPGKDGKKRRV